MSSADVSSKERDGVQYVPLRTIVEQLNGSIDWDNETKTTRFNIRGQNGVMTAGQNWFTVNGQRNSLTGTPFIEENTLYVPVDTLTDVGLNINMKSG